MSSQAIIAAITELTPSDLKKVKAAVDHLLNQEQKDIIPNTDDNIWLFYSQIERLMSNRGINVPPWPQLKKLRAGNCLQKNFPIVEAYTKRHFNKLNRRNRQQLYRIYVEVLIEWICANPYLPFMLATICKNTNKIPQIMANTFPGYAENGWLPIILLAKNGNTNLDKEWEHPEEKLP